MTRTAAIAPHHETVSPQPAWLLAMLCALMGFASISTDFYLPALPTMAVSLGASQRALELTVSAYLVGFSVGQLVWGPLGDRLGRKRPIAIGIALFIVGSSGCALAASAGQVIGWRVVQALGASVCVVLGRAMVRDLFDGQQAARMMSTLITIMAVLPLVAPWMGGQILAVAGWRTIFWLLVALALLTGAGLARVTETLPPERRSTQSLGAVLSGYGQLLRDAKVRGCAIMGGTYFMGVYAYIAGTPFAFIRYHHIAPQHYGLLFGSGIIGLMLFNMINVRLLPRKGTRRMMQAGGAIALVSGAAMGLAAVFDAGGVWGLFLPGLAFVSTSGFLVANSMADAMAGHPERAGAVSALLGAAQYGAGMVGSAMVGILANGTPVPMALVIAASGLGAACGVWLTVRAAKTAAGMK